MFMTRFCPGRMPIPGVWPFWAADTAEIALKKSLLMKVTSLLNFTLFL
jgi:hypothetical protein